MNDEQITQLLEYPDDNVRNRLSVPTLMAKGHRQKRRRRALATSSVAVALTLAGVGMTVWPSTVGPTIKSIEGSTGPAAGGVTDGGKTEVVTDGVTDGGDAEGSAAEGMDSSDGFAPRVPVPKVAEGPFKASGADSPVRSAQLNESIDFDRGISVKVTLKKHCISQTAESNPEGKAVEICQSLVLGDPDDPTRNPEDPKGESDARWSKDLSKPWLTWLSFGKSTATTDAGFLRQNPKDPVRRVVLRTADGKERAATVIQFKDKPEWGYWYLKSPYRKAPTGQPFVNPDADPFPGSAYAVSRSGKIGNLWHDDCPSPICLP
jgi:hypothetical protein